MRKIFFIVLVVWISCLSGNSWAKDPVNPTNALQSYLHNGDKTFDWKLVNQTKSEGLSLYQIVFTSQSWRSINWRHELFLMVPEKVTHSEALLFITGGSVKKEQPNLHKWDDGTIRMIGQIAKANQAITSIVFQVPNQPLYGDLTEDALISYTLHQFQGDRDFTWPLLFPMTKSAIRAMDVVQEFSKKELKVKVKYFVVSGASKRGWTTWLTGATDPRVKAIGPMVIDVLNMPVNIGYQKRVYGDYSVQIEDYVKLGLAQQMSSGGGKDLVDMIDPYSYRAKLTMPKMLFIGTNDEYWTADAVKNYISNIPGNNHICYIPNAGHDLGDKKQAIATLSAFFENTLNGGKYPVCSSSASLINGGVHLKVNSTADLLTGASLWSATSTDRDFRNEKWGPVDLSCARTAEVNVDVKFPASGYKAFYVELSYKTPSGKAFTECTRMFVTDTATLYLNPEQ